MTYVGATEVEIAASPTFTSGGASQTMRILAYSGQDINNNGSIIYARLVVDFSGYYITTDGWSFSAPGINTNGGSTTWNSGRTTVCSWIFWVGHETDGTKSYGFSSSFNSNYGVTGWNVSTTLELPRIPRTSNISLSTASVALDGSSSVVISTNRASTSFTHTIQQNFSGSFADIVGGVGDSYTWVPPTSWYSTIGNGSKAFTIRLITYSGSTQIGYTDASFTVSSAGISQESLSASSIVLNGSNKVTIYTNKKSSSFTHTIQQNFSGSFTNIATGVVDSTSWTPPVSYYTTIGGGSKDVTIRCITYSGSTQIGYVDKTFTINSAGADQVSLSNASMTMGNAYTVNIAKKISSFTHTVTWAFVSASDTLGTPKAVDTSVGWTPLKDLSAQIPTAMTGHGTVTCQTYYEDTPIGSTSVDFNLSVPSYNVVLGTPTITEEGTDAKSPANNLTTYGIGDTEILAIMSIKRLKVSATTSYGATITNISVTFGGKTLDTSNNTDKSTFNNTFNGMLNGILSITATDSRNRSLASTYSQTYSFRDYFLPTITAFSGDRTTTDTGTLTADGTFWNATAGTTANTVTGAISRSATGTAALTTKTDNTWTTSYAVTGVTYTNSYPFTITITDSFGNKATNTYILPVFEPVLWKGKHTVRIYRNLVVSNIVKAVKGYFTGDLKVGGKINASGNVTAPTFVGSLSGNATTSSSCTGNSATATKTITSVSGSGAAELVRCNMADNDQFRILAGGTGSNAGYAEISTADDGNEPIYVRQYTGVFSNLVRTATLLDGSGNTSFPGTLYVAGKSLLDKTYPVGAIYMSVVSTSPASLFGGSWTQITGDYFPLMGSSNPGETGGSWTTNGTTLTLDQIPSHGHNVQSPQNHTWGVNFGGGSGFCTFGFSPDLVNSNCGYGSAILFAFNSGGGQAHTHDHVPRYYRVYAWKRVS